MPSSPSEAASAPEFGQRILRAVPCLDLGRGQDHQLDAEAGIELAQLLLEQLHQLGIVAVGPAGADGRAVDRAVDPVERDLELAGADARLLELPAEGGEQAAGSGGDILGSADRLGEGQPRAESRRRPARLDGLGQGAQRLVQPGERLIAEAPRQRRARQGIEIADAAQPQLQEGLQNWRLDPQPLDRQRGERGALAVPRAEEIGLALGKARQRPGGARGVGHRGAAGEVVAREPFDQVGQQRAFAGLVPAEEMGAAGDVEQQAGIAAEAAGAAGFGAFLGDGAAQRIDRHPGRVAVAPVGDQSRSGGGRPAARRRS